MAELQKQYTEKLKQKEELKEKAEHTEKMLDRASKLVSGLAGERIRYERRLEALCTCTRIYVCLFPELKSLHYSKFNCIIVT